MVHKADRYLSYINVSPPYSKSEFFSQKKIYDREVYVCKIKKRV